MICFDVKARCVADCVFPTCMFHSELLHGLSENTAAKNGSFLLPKRI